jgi:hypothetical protein
MAKQNINVGTAANDKKGDSLRAAFVKVNSNFTELYTELGLVNDVTLSLGAFEFAGSTLSTTDSTAIVIDQAATITSNLSVGGDILPQTANGGDLGSSTLPWRSLYVSQSTIYLGGVPLTLDASNNLLVNGSLITGGGGSSVTTSATAPADPSLGDLWYDTESGRTYVYYDASWVDASPVDGVGISSYNDLTNKPTLFSGSYTDLTNKPNLAGTYQFSVAADDSTQRLISTDEVIKFIGAGGVTTSSDAEGNITINYVQGDIRSEGNINIDINLSDSTLYRWQFGEDGDLTLPNGGGSIGNGVLSIGNITTGVITLTNGAVIRDTAGDAVAIGEGAGETSQGNIAVAIGLNAGSTNQGGSAVAIGDFAGNSSQGESSVAVGQIAGETSQGIQAVAIGFGAGYTTQGVGAVAIGALAGYNTQGNNSIIINATGYSLNQTTPNTFTVKPVRQGETATPMYYNSSTGEITYADAYTFSFSVAGDDSTQRAVSNNELIKFIGAGGVTTSSDAEGNITITGSGGSSLVNGANTASLGADGALTIPGDIKSNGNINIDINLADSTLRRWQFGEDGALTLPSTGKINNSDYEWTFGEDGNLTTPGAITLLYSAVIKDTAGYAVAFGRYAGYTGQGLQAVAIGRNAGYTGQVAGAVAIGWDAGETTQGNSAVAVGSGAGKTSQGYGAVAVGSGAGYTGQGTQAVAIGLYAGYITQGAYSVAIGQQAGQTNQPANTIILNATGVAVNGVAAQTSSFYVDPIRNDASPSNVVYYNTTTKEVTYGVLPTATTSVLGGVKIDGTSIQINDGVISLNAGLSGAVTFKGGWNASTNTPTLINGTGTTGWMYIVTVGGTRNLGAGSLTYAASDLLIYDGTTWIQVAANNGVVSFNTRTGAVTLTSGDVTTALASTSANYILAAPNGTSGTASFRAAVLADISNLGTGVATFLATPTSANLASAITDETGTNKVLFSTSPTVTTSLITDSASFDLVNTTATTVNFAGAATTLSIGAATGTASVNNATVTLTNATAINVNGASPTLASTSTGTLTLFNTNLLTVNAFNAATTATLANSATTLGIGNTATAAQTVNMFTASTGASTYNFATGATASATTKAINIGTTGVSGSTTNIALGSAVSGATGTTTINTALTVTPAATATVTIGATAGTGALTFGQSTASQTVNIAAGVTASGSTKTIAIGTTGASGSTTAISIGSVVSGATSTLTFGGTVADATATSTAKSVGYLGLPQSATATTATLAIGDAGKHIYITTTGQTITIPANASVAYPIGTTITFIAGTSATTVSIAITSDTMRLAGGTSTGSRTLAANGMATAVKVAATTWYINGTGLT